MSRLLRSFTLVTAALLAFGACAPAAKQETVRRIARAVNAVGVRSGTISVVTRAIDAPPGLPGASTAALPPASLRFVVDRTARRAALLAPPSAAARFGISEGGSFPALVVFDADRVYVRAPDANLIGARPWLAVDLEGLGVVGTPSTQELGRPRTAGDLAVVSPVQLLDLALGVLTGSVERVSAGVYQANTSIEKEYRERGFEASDAEDFVDVLQTFAVKDDINPISVALDDSLALQRVTVDLIGKPEYGVKFATRFGLEFDPRDAAVDPSVLKVPARADVVNVSALGDARAAIDEWTLAGVQP